MAVLSSHIKEKSIGQILVNFPEPPVWSGGGGESMTHMLADDFLRQIHRVLVADGTLTLLSDNVG